jgi:hypothetical protein
MASSITIDLMARVYHHQNLSPGSPADPGIRLGIVSIYEGGEGQANESVIPCDRPASSAQCTQKRFMFTVHTNSV